MKDPTCAVAAKGRMVSPSSLMTASRAVCRGSTGGGGDGGGGEGGSAGGGDGGAVKQAPLLGCAAQVCTFSNHKASQTRVSVLC